MRPCFLCLNQGLVVDSIKRKKGEVDTKIDSDDDEEEKQNQERVQDKYEPDMILEDFNNLLHQTGADDWKNELSPTHQYLFIRETVVQ